MYGNTIKGEMTAWHARGSILPITNMCKNILMVNCSVRNIPLMRKNILELRYLTVETGDLSFILRELHLEMID